MKIYTKGQVKTLTKSQLEQLRGLPADIQQRERQILHIEKELEKVPNTMDSVQGSMPDHPYTAHAITIRGRDEQKDLALRARLRRQKKQLEKRQEEARALEIEARDFIERAPNSILRAALRGYYIDNLTWEEVADLLPNVTSESVRKMVMRYIDKNI